jgi:hypothetical protein
MTEEIASWSLFLDFPDESWVWGPEPDEDVKDWVNGIFFEVVSSGSPGAGLMAELRAFARSFQEHDAGALWIPSAEDGVVASLTVDVVAGDGSPLTLEAVEGLERDIAQEAGTPRSIERVELPTGPAVRARGPEPDPRGAGPAGLVETVVHTVVPGDLTDPDGSPAGVRMVMGWYDREQGDALADLADDLAGLLGIERDTTV